MLSPRVQWKTTCQNSWKNRKMATVIEIDPKTPFSIASTTRCRGGRYFIPWIAPLYPWFVPFIMVSVKQGGIKYHFFFSLWYDSTWDWTLVSQTSGESKILLRRVLEIWGSEWQRISLWKTIKYCLFKIFTIIIITLGFRDSNRSP